MFSKACEYGIRAVLFITVKSLHNQRTRLKEITSEIQAPEAFTAKVLQKLVKSDIVCSSTGPKGGFYMEKDKIDTLKLIKIVEAIDGKLLFTGCALGLPACNSQQPCPVHHRFQDIRADLKHLFSSLSVGELARDVDNELTFLKQ